MQKYTWVCAIACVGIVANIMGVQGRSSGSSGGLGGWRNWSSWSPCSCDGSTGQRSRTRTCSAPDPSACSGSNTETDTSACGGMASSCRTTTTPTPTPGPTSRKPGWGPWTPWSACPPCGYYAQKTRTRRCDNPPPLDDYSPSCEGSDQDVGTCIIPCRDGGWRPWVPWGSCSQTCGGGERTRNRRCDNPTPLMRPGGKNRNCTGPSSETERCNEQTCTVPAGWSPWTSWSPCPCGNGQARAHSIPPAQIRTRTCTNPPPAGPGAPGCKGDSRGRQRCTSQPCTLNDCSRCKYIKSVGYLPDANDETVFYQCKKDGSGYELIPMQCAPGTRWDNTKWVCVNRLCGGAVGAGFQRNPANCNSYLRCVHGEPIVVCCPPGTAWERVTAGNPCTLTNVATCNQECKTVGTWSDWGGWGLCKAKGSYCGAQGVKSRYRTCLGSNCAGIREDWAFCTVQCAGKCTRRIEEDPNNCAGFKVCNVDGTMTSKCCAAGTSFSNKLEACDHNAGRCTKTCGAPTCWPQIVDLPCTSEVKNQCQDCAVTHQTGVKVQSNVCKFTPTWKEGAMIQFDCFNNRFNEKNVVYFAVMTWFKTNEWPWGSGRKQSILHNGDCDEDPSIEIYLKERPGSDKYWDLIAYMNGQQVGIIELKVVPNQWFHVSLVRNGNVVRLSVRDSSCNDNSMTTKYISGAIKSTKCALVVGRKKGGGNFKGSMDDLRAYERGFTKDEVKKICKDQQSGK